MANKFERAGLRGWRLPSIEEMIESKAFCINEEGKADENDMPTFSFKESKLLCKSGNSPYVITFIDRGIWVRDFSFSYDELLAEKFKKDIVSTDESTAAHHGQRLHYCMTYGGDGGIGIWDCLNIATNTPGGYSGYPVILVNDGDSPRLNKEIEPTVNAMKTFQQNYLKRHQELYRAALAKQTAQEEKHKQINEASIKRLKNFQRNIKVGDRTFNGLILNIKGDLVQVQLTCAKITIIGVCERSSNGEIRWLRRDEIYPR